MTSQNHVKADHDAATGSVEQRVRETFADAGAAGFMHVREIGKPHSVDLDADTPVAVASVIKIVFAVAFARAVSAGLIDPTERARVPSRYQIGGTGTAGCADAVEMSLRDLALFMMAMSDNAATDVVYNRVGRRAIKEVIDELGLVNTRVRGDMESLALEVVAELGLANARDLDAQVRRAGNRAWDLALIDPTRTTCSTPRDIGILLEAIWTGHAGRNETSAAVRELMSHQITQHRLAAGFDEGTAVVSKTGTLPSVRNDAGVVTYADGRSYAVAVFTRARSLADHQPAIDAAIGHCARMAVDSLRS